MTMEIDMQETVVMVGWRGTVTVMVALPVLVACAASPP